MVESVTLAAMFIKTLKKKLYTLQASFSEPCQISTQTLGNSGLFLVFLHEKKNIKRNMSLVINLVMYLLQHFNFHEVTCLKIDVMI